MSGSRSTIPVPLGLKESERSSFEFAFAFMTATFSSIAALIRHEVQKIKLADDERLSILVSERVGIEVGVYGPYLESETQQGRPVVIYRVYSRHHHLYTETAHVKGKSRKAINLTHVDQAIKEITADPTIFPELFARVQADRIAVEAILSNQPRGLFSKMAAYFQKDGLSIVSKEKKYYEFARRYRLPHAVIMHIVLPMALALQADTQLEVYIEKQDNLRSMFVMLAGKLANRIPALSKELEGLVQKMTEELSLLNYVLTGLESAALYDDYKKCIETGANSEKILSIIQRAFKETISPQPKLDIDLETFLHVVLPHVIARQALLYSSKELTANRQKIGEKVTTVAIEPVLKNSTPQIMTKLPDTSPVELLPAAKVTLPLDALLLESYITKPSSRNPTNAMADIAKSDMLMPRVYTVAAVMPSWQLRKWALVGQGNTIKTRTEARAVEVSLESSVRAKP